MFKFVVLSSNVIFVARRFEGLQNHLREPDHPRHHKTSVHIDLQVDPERLLKCAALSRRIWTPQGHTLCTLLVDVT